LKYERREEKRMKKEFTGSKDFEAYYAAEKWIRESGLYDGSMERDAPIAISKNDWCAGMKWRNLYLEDKLALDGVICSGDKRNGTITVVIFDEVDQLKQYI